jgi:hypothetical protein
MKSTATSVSLYASLANLPFFMAIHPWFVVEKNGKLSRWEVTFETGRGENSWGHLRLDQLPAYSGIEVLPLDIQLYWPSWRIATVKGEVARQMTEFIEASPQTYPYRNKYALTGPNSNTYVQWVLEKFPDCGLKLPWNAFGKKYR